MKFQSELFTLIIFGATGNLAQLKLIPALYDLAEAGLLSESMTIVGVGRKKLSKEQFRQYLDEVLHKFNHHHNHPIKKEIIDKLLSKMTYISGDVSQKDVYGKLNAFLGKQPSYTNRLFYLATYPDLYSKVFQNLKKSGLNNRECGWVRVIIEKPIGTDLSSARMLNKLIWSYYDEDQIFRLDHYLGRETLQNILTFRFGNGVFEPLIHHEFIDHIQVTAAEDFGIGLRGGYYDSVGALKDVGQNHILQMLALTTMDAPHKFTNAVVTKKRIDLLESLIPDPKSIIFGQYEGYQKEKDVAKNSKTDTFFALRTTIKSDRFKNVPIYIRAGKKLIQTVTEVAIIFKVDKKRLFKHISGGSEPNVLIYRIQPNEGIVFKFLSKIPGPDLKLRNEYLQYCYRSTGVSLPDPYLRLLVDALRGNQTFFIDAPEVEAQWKFVDPLIESRKKPIIYSPGTWGPIEADRLIEADGRKWLEPSVAFCAL